MLQVSGVEAAPSTRLFNLWIEQKFGALGSLRVGQFTAAQEFLVSDIANLFVNSTFGWPVLPSHNLPSGGPNWPEATLGARAEWSPAPGLTLRAAAFNGDPAGPGTGDPVLRDPDGLAFRINDPPFVIAELEYDYNRDHRLEENNPNQEARALPARNRQGRGKVRAARQAGCLVDYLARSRSAAGTTPANSPIRALTLKAGSLP